MVQKILQSISLASIRYHSVFLHITRELVPVPGKVKMPPPGCICQSVSICLSPSFPLVLGGSEKLSLDFPH